MATAMSGHGADEAVSASARRFMSIR